MYITIIRLFQSYIYLFLCILQASGHHPGTFKNAYTTYSKYTKRKSLLQMKGSDMKRNPTDDEI